jgi:DNA-binding NtrC family response regulator
MDVFDKLKTLHILLVDDDEWIRDSLSIFFENEGCHLQTFENAEDALKVIDGAPYKIAIADYKLPGMTGLDFFKRIQRSHPSTERILITAYRNEEITAQAKKMGIDHIIYKPFSTGMIAQAKKMGIDHIIYKPFSTGMIEECLSKVVG